MYFHVSCIPKKWMLQKIDYIYLEREDLFHINNCSVRVSIGVRFEFGSDSVQFGQYFYRTKFNTVQFDSNLRQIRIKLPLQIEPESNPNLTRIRTKIEIDMKFDEH